MDINFDVIVKDSNSVEVDFPYHAVGSFDDWYAMQTWCKTHVGRRGYEWEARYKTPIGSTTGDFALTRAIFYFKNERTRNLFSLKWC